jgi:histone-lysine N-methyltransferase SETD3
MQERRKPVSEWDTYIDILPKHFDNFPIFFTEEDKQWLKGSPFLDQIHEKIEDIKSDYDLICKEVPEYVQFPIKEYSEIRMMVSSRIFGIQIEGVKTDAFVAYADMLNHKRPR